MERRGGSAASDRSAPPPPWPLKDRRQTPRDVQGRSSSRSPLPKLTPAFRRPEPHRRRADSYSKPIQSKLPHTMDQLYEKAKLEKALVFYTGGGRSSEALTLK